MRRIYLKLYIHYWELVMEYADWQHMTDLTYRAIRKICYARAELHQLSRGSGR